MNESMAQQVAEWVAARVPRDRSYVPTDFETAIWKAAIVEVLVFGPITRDERLETSHAGV